MREYKIELEYDGTFDISEYAENINNNYIYPIDWPEEYGFNKNALCVKSIKIYQDIIIFTVSEISGFGYSSEFKNKFTLNMIIKNDKLIGVNSAQNIPSTRINKFFKIINPRLLMNLISLK